MNCKEAESSTWAPTRYIQMGGEIYLSRETISAGCTDIAIWLHTPKTDRRIFQVENLQEKIEDA